MQVMPSVGRTSEPDGSTVHSADLIPFVEEYRGKLAPEHGQVFHVALQGIWTYNEFLRVIRGRFETADRALLSSVQALMGNIDRWSRVERLEAIKVQHGHEIDLHLQIESFYLFAKVLLDKVARFLQFFFGEIRAKPLTSHDQLAKRLPDYVRARGLILPLGFEEAVNGLKRDVADFRDYYIAHEQSPRTQRGTMWRGEEPGQLTLARVYSKPTEQQIVSSSVPGLMREIEAYLGLLQELLSENFEKTALKR